MSIFLFEPAEVDALFLETPVSEVLVSDKKERNNMTIIPCLGGEDIPPGSFH